MTENFICGPLEISLNAPQGALGEKFIETFELFLERGYWRVTNPSGNGTGHLSMIRCQLWMPRMALSSTEKPTR
jgi:hypothetical protein